MKTIDGIDVWPVPGYEGLYSISRCGKVWSHERMVKKISAKVSCQLRIPGRWRKTNINNHGYHCLWLSDKNQTNGGPKGQQLRIHRILGVVFLGAKEGQDIDHIDANKLNNNLSNLRVATRQQNLANNKKLKNNTSGFKGVYFKKRNAKWCAQIGISEKRTGKKTRRYLGIYDTAEEAAKAYDDAAIEQFGDFARLNFE